ncbi:MAG TPA: hypothetical protein VFA11_12060 [Acidimicrobiales bacterium]|nr:hypothetical protein [Acidimicrobiales bacterium]
MARQLELLDTLAAKGQTEFSLEEARAAFRASASATANALRRLQEKGLVDRVAHGRYAMRPFGALGTSTATDDPSLAVGIAFEELPHRIAYLSALASHDLLAHPVRTIFVASVRQVRFTKISRHPLRVIIEKADTIHLHAEPVGRSWRSTLDRAIFEAALRLDLVGGIERLVEAVARSAADTNPTNIAELAKAFGPRGLAAQRRIATLARTLDLPLAVDPAVTVERPVIRLDPRDDHVEWTDARYRVAWNRTVDELREVIGN